MEFAFLIIGLLVGATVSWIVVRSRLATDVTRLRLEVEHERSVADEKVGVLTQAREQLSMQLQAMCAEALRGNSEQFMQLARAQFEQLQLRATHDLDSRQKAVESLVTPIKESLEKVNTEVKTLETARIRDVTRLSTLLTTVAETNDRLRTETNSLVTALRAPSVHGRWGELQLKNAVEAAGMLAYCDFVVQATGRGDENGLLRPDLVVRLPGGRTVVVDAKTPIQALLDAHQTDDDAVRTQRLADFARNVRDHVAALKAKSYWKQFESAPDFVVMFLPGESFFRAAIEQDPSLLELHAQSGIILASPATLITMLRTVASSWREEQVAQSARAISELGRELYERLGTMTEHLVTLGKRLDGSVQAYNQTVGSFERRVLVSARKFPEHGVTASKDLPEVLAVEKSTQPPQTLELPVRTESDSGSASADAA
jgi:DNA recombination protein RmuC